MPRLQLPNPGFVWLSGIRDLQWRRRRFVIAVLGTSLVFALTLLLSAFLESFYVEVDRSLAALGSDGLVVPEGTAGPFTSVTPIEASAADGVRTSPGVTAADPVITMRQTIPRDDALEVFLIGHRPGGLATPVAAEGRTVRSNGEAVVDTASDLVLGEEFALGGVQFRVVGRVNGLTLLGGVPAVFVPLQDAQTVAFRGQSLATAVLVRGTPSSLPNGLAAFDMAAARADLLRPLVDTVDSIKLFRLLLWVVAAAIIGSVLYLSALERVRDFAVFKATGTPTVDLLGCLALQAVLLSLSAAIVAIGLARLLAPQFPADVSFPAKLVLLLPVVATIVGLLGSVAGLRRAVSVEPALAFGSAS